LISKTNLVL